MTEHVLVVHRWPDGRARYDRSLDHLFVDVSYVCTGPASASVPATAAGREVVRRTDDLAELAGAAGRLSRQIGRPPSRIVALAEGDRLAAAELRVLLGCPGQEPAAVAEFAPTHPPVGGPEVNRIRLDGLWDGTGLRVARSARPVPGLAQPEAVGMVELDATEPVPVAAALDGRLAGPATVHLDLRVTGPGGYVLDRCTPWLPDDELPLAWQEVHGVDLLAAELALQLGRPLPSTPPPRFDEVAGWLTVRPAAAPCVVERAEYRPSGVPAYAVELAAPGTVLGDRVPAARLRLRGESTAAVERAVRQAARELVLGVRPV